MKTINVDKVKELFESKGLIPDRGTNRKRTCIVDALLYPEVFTLENLAKHGYNNTYIAGLIEAWDEEEYEYETDVNFTSRDSLEYKIGFAQGTAARKIIFGK